MSMHYTTIKSTVCNIAHSQSPGLRNAMSGAVLVIVYLGLMTTSALSFDSADKFKDFRSTRNINLKIDVSHETSHQFYTHPSTAGDMCLSLLNKQQFTPALPSADRDRRTAGIATLGTLLAVRLALEHANTSTQALSVQNKSLQTISKRNIHSIAAYRDCRKNEALNAHKVKDSAPEA